jgi:WD40 repeat protein
MDSLHARLFVVLFMLLSTRACVSSSRSSRDFVASLEGQLVFEDFSAHDVWYMLDFSGATAKMRQSDESALGVFSPDEKWQLLFIEEKDTNDDGVVDYSDLSLLYLSRVGSSEKKRVDLPFPVGTCAWGTEYMVAACSFAASDVSADENESAGDNSVVYVVDNESGELLRRLSDPAKSSWSLTWSPDGTMIAFRTGIETESNVEPNGIQVVDTRTGELAYEIAEPSASEPVWSPDSTRLAFVASLESGEYSEAKIEHMYRDVFYVNLRDESPTVTNVTRTSRFSEIPACLTHLGGIMVSDPVWSPDGEVIASVWRQDSSEQIWVTSVDGDDWTRLTRGFGHRYLLTEWQP